jgi:hypothetical protein
LEWLAKLGVEHDNIIAAMRGTLAAAEAHRAMRLAAGAGWYWYLAGHKVEGNELTVAATKLPGEVPDDLRAMVYGLVVNFVTSGVGGDEHAAREWIHQAFRYSQRSGSRYPLLVLLTPLERMLRSPSELLPAWEALLDEEDPWIRALGRLQLGKMRIVLGEGGTEADEHLELALAEFRALGERFGIWFALTELADRIATRGEFARACELYEQAIAVVTEMGSADDIIRSRASQARLYWRLGDADASAAAIAEAQRCAELVTWPDALADLAFTKAVLARWRGDAETAYSQLDVATALLGEEAQRASIRAATLDLLGYLAEDLDTARAHREAAYRAAAESGHASAIANVLVGIADLALRSEEYEQAARLIAASAAVRGLADLSHPDLVRIEQATRHRLGEAKFVEATEEGRASTWSELAASTLTA